MKKRDVGEKELKEIKDNSRMTTGRETMTLVWKRVRRLLKRMNGNGYKERLYGSCLERMKKC